MKINLIFEAKVRSEDEILGVKEGISAALEGLGGVRCVEVKKEKRLCCLMCENGILERSDYLPPFIECRKNNIKTKLGNVCDDFERLKAPWMRNLPKEEIDEASKEYGVRADWYNAKVKRGEIHIED